MNSVKYLSPEISVSIKNHERKLEFGNSFMNYGLVKNEMNIMFKGRIKSFSL